MKSGPLLAVPDSLRMNAAMSQKRLMPTINMCELPPLGKFSESIQTSLLLAFEKRKGAKQHLRTHREACVPGSDSFWAPYIETLPSTPSCAWILPENELRVEIVLLPSHIRDSEDCLERAKLHAMAYQQEIEEAIDDYGDALGLEFDDVKWALGHVHSRAYGEECSLIPIVDLLNHHAAAMPPLGSELCCLIRIVKLEMCYHRAMSDDDIPMTYVGSFYYGTPRSLQPGDELFINYSFPKHLSPLAIFLDFGFLPQEFTKVCSNSCIRILDHWCFADSHCSSTPEWTFGSDWRERIWTICEAASIAQLCFIPRMTSEKILNFDPPV